MHGKWTAGCAAVFAIVVALLGATGDTMAGQRRCGCIMHKGSFYGNPEHRCNPRTYSLWNTPGSVVYGVPVTTPSPLPSPVPATAK